MIGTIANTSTILIGSVVGSTLKKGIGEKYKTVMMDAMGLAATGLGINSIVQAMPESRYHVLFIVSLALGGLIGTRLDLASAFDRVVSKISRGSNLAQGLSTAILLFCAGTLSILGPMQSAPRRRVSPAYDGNQPGGRYIDPQQRTGHPEYQADQDIEPASGPSGAARGSYHPDSAWYRLTYAGSAAHIRYGSAGFIYAR